MQRILNKETFIRFSQRKLLGNTFQTWNTFQEIPKDFNGSITIRNREKDSPFFVPTIHSKNLYPELCRLEALSCSLETIYFQEIPHTSNCTSKSCQGCGRVLNGQAMRNEQYIDLIYGTNPNLNLRTDLENSGLIVTGLKSVLLLKSLYNCYEDLHDIWNDYPESIIEFSVFSRGLGWRNTNTIIWEVRNY
jgi:hypothetical protein